MSAQVILRLFNELRKRDKMRALHFNNTGARMLDLSLDT